MKRIFDEYGEAILGVAGILVIMAIAVALFNSGGIIENYFTDIANAAI